MPNHVNIDLQTLYGVCLVCNEIVHVVFHLSSNSQIFVMIIMFGTANWTNTSSSTFIADVVINQATLYFIIRYFDISIHVECKVCLTVLSTSIWNNDQPQNMPQFQGRWFFKDYLKYLMIPLCLGNSIPQVLI